MTRNNLIVVPNVEQIAREMTSTSQIGIILNRIKGLGFREFISFGINNLSYSTKILQKDFAAGIKVLCELEILQVHNIKLKEFVLHNQMVDMAIALRNKQVITYFFALAKQYDFQPGLLTYNLASLIKLLADIRVIPKNLIIYTKIDSKSSLTEYLKDSPIRIKDWKN